MSRRLIVTTIVFLECSHLLLGKKKGESFVRNVDGSTKLEWRASTQISSPTNLVSRAKKRDPWDEVITDVGWYNKGRLVGNG